MIKAISYIFDFAFEIVEYVSFMIRYIIASVIEYIAITFQMIGDVLYKFSEIIGPDDCEYDE